MVLIEVSPAVAAAPIAIASAHTAMRPTDASRCTPEYVLPEVVPSAAAIWWHPFLNRLYDMGK
jgi:hypothetical protein